jgi:hypothetical protein
VAVAVSSAAQAWEGRPVSVASRDGKDGSVGSLSTMNKSKQPEKKEVR